MPKQHTFDPRSDAVVLTYQGKPADEEAGEPGWEPALVGIPARDLTEADIARIVYAEAINAYDGTDPDAMPDPTKPSQARARDWLALLAERRVDGKLVYRRAHREPAEDEESDASKSDTPAATPAEPEV